MLLLLLADDTVWLHYRERVVASNEVKRSVWPSFTI